MATQLHTPPAEWAPPPPPYAPPPDRPSRAWMWWTAFGVTLGALTVGGMFVVDRTMLRHDLITADFEESAEPFVTGTNDEYSASLANGTYELRARVDPTSPTATFGMFTRTAYNVDIAVDIIDVEDPDDDNLVGVMCMDLPESNGHGYAFVVGPEGYAIKRTDQPELTLLASSVEAPTWPIEDHRIGITCEPRPGKVLIGGYVDGTKMISAVDEDGFGTYRAGGMWFDTFTQGDYVRFDNVTARVPGE
jgi:hypothetical protein